MAKKRKRRDERKSRGMQQVVDFVITMAAILSVILALLLYNKKIPLNVINEWLL